MSPHLGILTLAVVDAFSIFVKRPPRQVAIMPVVTIGDWVLSFLSLAAALSAASLTDILITSGHSNVNLCAGKLCIRYQLSAAMAFLSWFWCIYNMRASSIHVNVFSGEATTQFPTATQTARGGISADAMGLGKTVMTISLILARSGRGIPEAKHGDTENLVSKGTESNRVPRKARGGTHIICPMVLLGQWKWGTKHRKTYTKDELNVVCFEALDYIQAIM